MKKKSSRTFKENIKRLEEITSKLDNSDIDLEEAIELYEEGIGLSKICLETLKNAELKVTELKNKLEIDSFDKEDSSEE